MQIITFSHTKILIKDYCTKIKKKYNDSARADKIWSYAPILFSQHLQNIELLRELIYFWSYHNSQIDSVKLPPLLIISEFFVLRTFKALSCVIFKPFSVGIVFWFKMHIKKSTFRECLTWRYSVLHWWWRLITRKTRVSIQM